MHGTIDPAPHDDIDAPRMQRRRRPLMVAVLVGVLLICAGLLARSFVAPPAPPAAMAMAPPTVTVSTPLQRKLATYTTFTGQFSAVDRVEIRAQVSGYLTEIHFTDGQLVKKGDLLFVIDPRPYAIALQTAQAQLETAQASLSLAVKELSRSTELKRSDFASGETVDQRTQQQAGAAASLDQAKAAVRSAQLNMEFTHITSPISGRISRHQVSVGNLVTGGQTGGTTTLLTTVVSLDPIYLDFDLGEGDYLAYQRYLHAPRNGAPVDRTVEIALSDESGWPHRGELDFIDNEMDRASGTIQARATVPNHDLLIAAGEFARLRVPTAGAADTLLVPDAAISADQSRMMLMVVAPDGTVVPKTVVTGPLVGDLRIVKAGLARDDKVVIDGLMRARPGMKVTPTPGTIATPADQG